MEFYINCEKWHIFCIEPTSEHLMRSDNVYTLGVTDNNLKTIFVNNRLRGRMLDKVVCHELVHVFSFSHDLNIPIDTEEIIADFLATYGRNIFTVADELLGKLIKVAV